MEYSKIKRAAKDDPSNEFILYAHSGQPSRRWSKRAVVVSTDKQEAVFGFGIDLDSTRLATQLQTKYTTGNFGVLVRYTDLDGTNERYTVAPTRWFKGNYSDYEAQWAVAQSIEAKIHTLELKVQAIKNTESQQSKKRLDTKTSSIVEFLKKYAFWNGNLKQRSHWSIVDNDSVEVSSSIETEFASKHYPEFAAAGYSFNTDPDKYETKVKGEVSVGIELMENLMESMLALQDKNFALTIELEKEKRNKNGN